MPGSSRNVAFALPEAAVPVGARAAAQLSSSPVAAAASVVAETVVPAGPLDIASAHADAEAAAEAEAAELVAAEVVPQSIEPDDERLSVSLAELRMAVAHARSGMQGKVDRMGPLGSYMGKVRHLWRVVE